MVYKTFPSVRKRYCSARCAGLGKRTATVVACLVCGTLVKSHVSRPRQYCSKSHAMTARNLTDANPAKHRDISGEKNPMWGKEGMRGPANPMWGRRGALSPTWKDGKRRRPDGYVRVYAPEGHPHPSEINKRTGQAYLLEHRLVMEGLLGRYLRPEEVVHHRDGNPSNNAPANLQLFASQEEHVRVGHPHRRVTHPAP